MDELFDDRLKGEGDAFYARLMEAHRDLSPEDSARLNARLVLMMANVIGDGNVLAELIRNASER